MVTYCVSCRKILQTKIQVSEKLLGKKLTFTKNKELHNLNNI